ncbi:iron-sulfur cluster biosynthesis family protein [Lactobacillus sp. ESL0731]|uniref:iron-sulfur cluster biosynthesis family protein n=1 Tax=unclassified Lactobacillus TaxID=2620435 RepID=UPI0023F6DC5B|nr:MULTISPECIES: iron-sulfur cluster biosynthesis family protein [unclassified Lactobacillus]WEV51223.1 iron-sulfur cluster biosynthesis family protein [Lactobacillus sp. ESL0700]WEV62353.1 iron-sulfur cluster biosynthesis family protein [Lactobacillus sp. ESL0731]
MNNAETIEMNIKPEAAARIKSHVKEGQVVLLALNDGSNQYSKVGGTCTIGANFQFVILDQKDPEFSIIINNNVGLNLFTSPAEMQYLDNSLVVSEKNATLSLADDSGVIDGAVSINEFQPSDITAKDLQEGKTC